MLVTNAQADELFSTLSQLSGLDPKLSEICGDLVRTQRYDEAVSRAFVVLEERLRETLGVHGGAGVHLSQKAFAPDSGDLVDRLARPRGEVDGIRNLFVGAFKAYRNRAAHTMADYSLSEARAVIHLVNLLLLILKQVEQAPTHQIRKDVAELLEPDARRRLSAFLDRLQEIGIRKGEGGSKTPYKAILWRQRPSWDTARRDEVSVFYLNATGGKPRIEFRMVTLAEIVGLDVHSLEDDLLQAGCVRVGLKTVPIWLYLNRHNDQDTFNKLYRILRELVEKQRASRFAALAERGRERRYTSRANAATEQRQATATGAGGRTTKYEPLREFLEKVPSDVQERTLSFRQVESILGFALPASARRHRAWWSNPSSPGHHSHAQAWLAAGWKVDTVDQEDEWVRFRRAS